MFSKQLIAYRKQLNLSQKDIANKLNITQQAYSLYENGKREPNFDMLKKICVIFSCSTDEILEFDLDNYKKDNK